MPSLVTRFTPISTNEQPPEKSPARKAFDNYANLTREAQSIRQKKAGRGGFGGGANWWAKLPENFRVFILSTMAGDDWERYAGAAWDALPDGLRSAIALECRALARVAQGCPWR